MILTFKNIYIYLFNPHFKLSYLPKPQIKGLISLNQ